MVVDLVIDHVQFSYVEKEPILRDISLHYTSPDVLCILGANGTGKSTLLQCVIGTLTPKYGTITIDGTEISRMPAPLRAQKLAYLAQIHHPTFAFPVIEVVTMGRTAHLGIWAQPQSEDYEKAYEKLCFLGIDHLAHKPYTDLSGGERQLVMIASALAQQPELIILDEPTSHLDFGKQYTFIELVARLREAGQGVLMTTHFPDHALQLESTCAIMSDGIIQTIGPAHEAVCEQTLQELYRIPVSLTRIKNRSICIPGTLT